MDEQNNLRVIFTKKADAVLAGIMNKYNLEENDEQTSKKVLEKKPFNVTTLNHLAKKFVRENMSKIDLSNSLQKEIELPQQTADKVSDEIITTLIPLLEKAPEEKFNDPTFREEISKKVTGESEPQENKNIFYKVEPATSVDEIIKKNILAATEEPKIAEPTKIETATPPKKRERIKKIITPAEAKESNQQTNQTKGSDRYREPIE